MTPEQVQAVWLKESVAGEQRRFPKDARGLQSDLRAILRIMRVRYPNVKLVYLSSRTYGGYAITGLNPEPAAYDSAYAVRGIIQERIRGKIKGPWLFWGPYLWTDGMAGRNDGLVWSLRRRRGGRHASVALGHPEGREHADDVLQDGSHRQALVRRQASLAPVTPLCTIAPVNGQVGIVGAGYVGLPLAQVFAESGNKVLLVEANPEKVELVKRGESYIRDVESADLKRLVDEGSIEITTDYDALKEVEAILIALQTPLSAQREPDLSIVLGAVEDIAPRLQPGQLVVLESTTYPGTTRERLLPILERSGLKAGEDFHLAFSPERVDPGREDWTTKNTPKIVGGITPACTERAVELYAPRHRHGAPGLVARGGRADEAPREHLPVGEHRARQRARPAL